jgi:tetratricopeptide (TPR) repeat protein
MSKDEVLKTLATTDTFALRRAGELLAADGDTGGAVTHFKRAIELFPYYTDDGNAYAALAKIYEEKGQLAEAADAWDLLVKQDENNLDALKNIARLRLALNDRTRALDALKLSFYLSPFDYGLHARAGELSMEARTTRRRSMSLR